MQKKKKKKKKKNNVKLTSGSRLFTVQDSASGSIISVRLKNVLRLIQRLVKDSANDLKMTSVLFSVWFRIQHTIKKWPEYYSVSVWFRAQRAIKKWPEYYSVSCSGFSIRLKNDQRIIQCLVQDSVYESKMTRELFSVWFRNRRTIKNISVLSGSGFSVQLKNDQRIIQRLVQDSAYD